MFYRVNVRDNVGLESTSTSASSRNEDVGKHYLASILENGVEPKPKEVLS